METGVGSFSRQMEQHVEAELDKTFPSQLDMIRRRELDFGKLCFLYIELLFQSSIIGAV